MKFEVYKTTLQDTLSRKNLALWICAGLAVSNLGLCLKLINSEEHWVLIPQNNIDLRLSVTSSKHSDAYFIEWASQIVNTLLCVNPESYEWKVNQILMITTLQHGTLKEKLTQEADKIKQEQISTVFYPKEFTVNQQTKSVEVAGQHITYFGKKSTPVETTKTFRLSWIISNHGLILLKDFVEVKHD